jgi:hypothetical protein
MKTLALVFGALLVLGAASGAVAQQGGQPAASGSVSGSASGDVKAPSTNVDVKSETRTSAPASRPGIDVNVNKTERSDTTAKTETRTDDGAALPRGAAGGSSTSSTTIFGLSPTAAVIVAAALLVVVILAIVAMTRSGAETTYIDRDRRPPVV